MSRDLFICDNGMYIYLKDEKECFYKTNKVCFNNKCKWYGKKCYNICENFKKETLKRYEY